MIAMSDLNNTNFSEMSSYYPVTGEVVEDPLFDDVTPWDMSEEMVEVDQTPLQDQIQKNKKCKYLQSDLQINCERLIKKIGEFQKKSQEFTVSPS